MTEYDEKLQALFRQLEVQGKNISQLWIAVGFVGILWLMFFVCMFAGVV